MSDGRNATPTREAAMENSDWTLVLDFTRGDRRRLLSAPEARELRLLADGFGDLRGVDSAECAAHQDLLWDWSHVRDSSDAAVARMSAWIRARFPAPCGTCGGSGAVRPHPTALVAVSCPDCGGAR
jgi:hypothetical protein